MWSSISSVKRGAISVLLNMAYQSLSCKQLILLSLTCCILAVNADENKAKAARQADNHLSSGLSDAVENTTEGQTVDEEDFPTWIIVIVVVVVGLIIVSCCLCIVKIRQWRKDQGTYSIWNEHQSQHNVESMYARESGVIFEKLDIELDLTEDRCYEIPVDSFVTPERVYIGGVRVSPAKESLEESLKSNEQRMSESAKRMAIANDNVYGTVLTDRISRTSDVTSTGENMPNSVFGDTSKHSSVTSQSDSPTDRSFTPGLESPEKETYCKPLPVIPDEPVTCETYKLSKEDRVSALVNRPLPRTPPYSPSLAVGSSASLDRSLLKQQHEERLQKPNVMFQTLPRPRKIRQLRLPKPLVSVMTRSSSSNDVTVKEARGLKDHVAYDTNDCTLTRVKKRLSQSLDTLLASQRTSHFYENPYLMLSDEDQMDGHQVPEDHGETLEDPNVQSQYPSVPSCADDEEELPRDREHLYARISTCMDTAEENLNRHSYASVHYGGKFSMPLLPRPPSSRHTYISVVFGSADSVFESPSLRAKPTTHRKSRSCADLSSVRRSFSPGLRSTPEHESPKNRYVNVAEVSENREEFPRVQFSRPYNSFHGFAKTNESSCSDVMDGIQNGGFRRSNATSPGLSPSAETTGCYQNVNEAFDLDPSFVQSPTQDSASTPSNERGSVVHDISNGHRDVQMSTPSAEAKGRYVNVNETLDASFVSPIPASASTPSNGTCGVVHHIPNGPETNGRCVQNLNELLETSLASPIGRGTPCSPQTGTYPAVPCIPNGDITENREHLMALPVIKSRYENVNEAFDASFVPPVPNCSAATSSSDGSRSMAHHSLHESATTASGDSSYLADNSGSILGDSSVFSERNLASQVSTTSISTRDTESSMNDSYYGVPKNPVKPLERFNGNLGEPLSSGDGGTIKIYNKCNGVDLNGLDERCQPRTLSTYLEGRLGIGLEHREDVDNEEHEHAYENYISSKRQSCESRVSSRSDDEKLSSIVNLGIEEKESESEPLISKCGAGSDLNGNAVCGRFAGKLQLQRNSSGFPGNHLSDESVV